jgi:Leucine-rich repeat (LRR) protein
MLQVHIFFSKSNQPLYALKMSHKIKAIRERLEAINYDRRSFNLEVRPVETRVGNRERDNTHSFVLAEVVIGRQDDKKAVIDRLLDSNIEDNVSILPIVAIGGLGKTTLAQFIFNDEQIQKKFQLKMWVCVSNIFDVKNIVRKILESARKKEVKIVEMDTLVNDLRKEIEGKKYFLVLDDVWNEDNEKWCSLKKVLMVGGRGSRILVTTRYESVAMTIRNESVVRIIGTVQSYFLQGLDKEASWCLFRQMAFEKGQEPKNPRIVAIGKEIVKKCVGVPLAIRTMGSLLYFKNSETEWSSFKNNELSKISQNENDILPTLKLSYDHLPSHLKHCFAYCSLFPKDYMINKSTLIQLWMAQGFIKLSNQNRCLEDVGHEYFMDLLWRSFFQEAEMDEFGDIIKCKIHDLMHDLAISVAGSLITTLDDKEINIDDKTRQVAVAYHISSSFEVTTLLCKATRMRTFLYHGQQDFKANIDCDATFSSSKFLHVLDLHRSQYGSSKTLQNLSFIGMLKHLRYIDLSYETKMKKLPDSITRLQNLQTLKLSRCVLLEELPRDIKKLVNLRHLEIDFCNSLSYMPVGLGQLTNLQTLSAFYVHSGSPSRHSDSGGLQELGGLNKLRGRLIIKKLGHGKSKGECKAANLKAKQHLRTLSIQWSDSDDANNWDEASLEGLEPHPNLKGLSLYHYQGSRLPSWLLLLTNLVEFRLYSCTKCEYLPTLSHLPSLKKLILCLLEAMEYISEDGDSNEFSSSSTVQTPFFPSLEFIWLDDCPNLKGWWRRRKMDSSVELNSDSDNSVERTEHHLLPSFPRLSKLIIWDCPMLTSIEWIHNCKSLQVLEIRECLNLASLPEGMYRLTSLQKLTIKDCPILLQRYNRDTGKDWAKIAHIPELDLW